MTGEFVSGHDSWTNDVSIKPEVEILTERLVENGYMTAAVGIFEPNPPDEKILVFTILISLLASRLLIICNS